MNSLTWQNIVDEMQADGWAVDWDFSPDETGTSYWVVEAISATRGDRHAKDPSLHCAMADLQVLTRASLSLA